jgi:uncharacterized protein
LVTERLQDVTPWYRQFWPWFLIALPAMAVVGSLVSLILAVRDPDGLVEDDYYRSGLAVNQDLLRDRRAYDLGLSAQLKVDTSAGMAEVVLRGSEPIAVDALQLSFVHPTRTGKDITALLQRRPDGIYGGVIGRLVSGRWHIVIEPPDMSWRLTARITIPGEIQVSMHSGPVD